MKSNQVIILKWVVRLIRTMLFCASQGKWSPFHCSILLFATVINIKNMAMILQPQDKTTVK